MKNSIKLFVLVVLSAFLSCQSKKSSNDTNDNSGVAANEKTAYDSLLAAKYGADGYGMKKYVMAFLKRGPNRSPDSAKAMELQMAHLKNIQRMAEEGTLVLAGPFFGSGEVRGIYIFDVPDLEKARELVKTDPAIQAGSLEMELREWYGSAALMAVNNLHKRIAKKGITDE